MADYSVIDEAPKLHITDFGYLSAKCHYGLMIDNLLDLNPSPEWTMVKISRATAGEC